MLNNINKNKKTSGNKEQDHNSNERNETQQNPQSLATTPYIALVFHIQLQGISNHLTYPSHLDDLSSFTQSI